SKNPIPRTKGTVPPTWMPAIHRRSNGRTAPSPRSLLLVDLADGLLGRRGGGVALRGVAGTGLGVGRLGGLGALGQAVVAAVHGTGLRDVGGDGHEQLDLLGALRALEGERHVAVLAD